MPSTINPNTEKWTAGLADEIRFWEHWIEARGGQWPAEFAQRLNPLAPLQVEMQNLIGAPVGAQVNILDVGAGAMTWLGKTWPGRVVSITAIDPLAREFDRLFAKHGIVPPVRTIYGQAEEIVKDFGPDRFDLVMCRNAMDHSSDPLAGIRTCLAVVKPGCNVLLHHFINEAVNQKYEGLHQWNFESRDGRFVIWNPGATIDVAERVADLCDEVIVKVPAPNWITVALRKRRPNGGPLD
jgi:SAM-dependent methyltransferase